jgi:molybdopterin-guanine dinucleotide biosynthesis protein A
MNGLILAGGKSSRMHHDKDLIVYHGKPQREYLTDLLRHYCSEVYVSIDKSKEPFKNSIVDHFDLNSPLNGILSAFHFDPDATWLTVPIDMPNIGKPMLDYLIKHRDPHKVATCFADSEGEEPEPLITIWEHKSKPMLFDFFNSGGFSAKKFLQENDINIVPCPRMEWLLNINTEEELKQYLKK